MAERIVQLIVMALVGTSISCTTLPLLIFFPSYDFVNEKAPQIVSRSFTIHVKNHMAFYWGERTDTMFPGCRGPSSWALVFWLSVLVEWISHTRLIRPGINNVAASLTRTMMYAVRIAVPYTVMLTIMSFDASVLIAAVVGHAGGFLLFSNQAFKNKSRVMDYQEPSDFSLHRTADGH